MFEFTILDSVGLLLVFREWFAFAFVKYQKEVVSSGLLKSSIHCPNLAILDIISLWSGLLSPLRKNHRKSGLALPISLKKENNANFKQNFRI